MVDEGQLLNPNIRDLSEAWKQNVDIVLTLTVHASCRKGYTNSSTLTQKYTEFCKYDCEARSIWLQSVPTTSLDHPFRHWPAFGRLVKRRER